MRALLLEFPELLSLNEEGPVFRAALPCDSDLVLAVLDETGNLALAGVESGASRTSASPPSAPRPRSLSDSRLVADILWTGAMLWRKSYADFASDFRRRTGTALEVRVAEKAGPGWSLERFRDRLSAVLSQGRFPILIVSVEPGPLAPDITYLQSMNLEVTACILTACRIGDVEAILTAQSTARPVPHTPAKEQPVPRPPEPKPVVSPRPVNEPAEPKKVPVSPQPKPAPEPEESTPSDFPWARAGTKPGVMSDKRPPAQEPAKRKPERK